MKYVIPAILFVFSLGLGAQGLDRAGHAVGEHMSGHHGFGRDEQGPMPEHAQGHHKHHKSEQQGEMSDRHERRDFDKQEREHGHEREGMQRPEQMPGELHGFGGGQHRR